MPEDLYKNIQYADGSKETKDLTMIESGADAREDNLEPLAVKAEVGESEKKGEQKKGILGKLNSLKV